MTKVPSKREVLLILIRRVFSGFDSNPADRQDDGVTTLSTKATALPFIFPFSLKPSNSFAKLCGGWYLDIAPTCHFHTGHYIFLTAAFNQCGSRFCRASGWEEPWTRRSVKCVIHRPGWMHRITRIINRLLPLVCSSRKKKCGLYWLLFLLVTSLWTDIFHFSSPPSIPCPYAASPLRPRRWQIWCRRRCLTSWSIGSMGGEQQHLSRRLSSCCHFRYANLLFVSCQDIHHKGNSWHIVGQEVSTKQPQ